MTLYLEPKQTKYTTSSPPHPSLYDALTHFTPIPKHTRALEKKKEGKQKRTKRARQRAGQEKQKNQILPSIGTNIPSQTAHHQHHTQDPGHLARAQGVCFLIGYVLSYTQNNCALFRMAFETSTTRMGKARVLCLTTTILADMCFVLRLLSYLQELLIQCCC